jgi:hypothetical protein
VQQEAARGAAMGRSGNRREEARHNNGVTEVAGERRRSTGEQQEVIRGARRGQKEGRREAVRGKGVPWGGPEKG